LEAPLPLCTPDWDPTDPPIDAVETELLVEAPLAVDPVGTEPEIPEPLAVEPVGTDPLPEIIDPPEMVDGATAEPLAPDAPEASVLTDEPLPR